MSTATFVRTRVRSPKFAAILAGGDALAVVAFVLLGSLDHGFGIDPARVLMSATPFVVGWLVAAVPLGLYGDRATTLGRTGVLTVVAWTIAVGIGGSLRSTSYFPGASPPTFLLVTFVFCGIIITGWRLTAAFAAGRKEQ
ncbi:MAG: DUF3054 domain-containing protein [Halovenus sp.]